MRRAAARHRSNLKILDFEVSPSVSHSFVFFFPDFSFARSFPVYGHV